MKGFVADEEPPAEEENLELPVIPLPVEGEDILVRAVVGNGLLFLQGLFDGLDLVADPGGFLEVQILRGRPHPVAEKLEELGVLPFQEEGGPLDQSAYFSRETKPQQGPRHFLI